MWHVWEKVVVVVNLFVFYIYIYFTNSKAGFNMMLYSDH